MSKMKAEVIGSAPYPGLGNTRHGCITNAVKELPGEPYRLNSLFFRFEDVAMVVYDGMLVEI
jgi:hypothetical protein